MRLILVLLNNHQGGERLSKDFSFLWYIKEVVAYVYDDGRWKRLRLWLWEIRLENK